MANGVPSSILEQIFRVRGRDPLTESLRTVGPGFEAAGQVLERQRMRTPVDRLFPQVGRRFPFIRGVPAEDAGFVTELATSLNKLQPSVDQPDALRRARLMLDLLKAQREQRIIGPQGDVTQVPGLSPELTVENLLSGEVPEGAAGTGNIKFTPRATSSQFIASGFADRLSASEFVFAEIESEGFDAAGLWPQIQKAGFFPERAKSEHVKRLLQAQRNFVNAVLRRESGAAINPSEFESAGLQYFDQPGDNQKVKNQKKLNRLLVRRVFQAEAKGVVPAPADIAALNQQVEAIQQGRSISRETMGIVPRVGQDFRGEKIIRVKRIR